MSKKVLVFGTFDPLHAGHEDFFRQAQSLGDQLIVVVTRDQVIRRQKKREPYQAEEARRQAVAGAAPGSMVILGDMRPEDYGVLRTQSFDILALGYDQSPPDAAARQLLDRLGKQQVAIVRLQPFKSEQYKSSYLRPPASPSGTLA